jgi:site-specific DNA-methyltransferase (adenine-specific)
MISEVYNIDCIEGMKQYPDKYFELAIVDPPYGLDLANMNMGIGKSKKASKIQNRKWDSKDWDKIKPTDNYFKELFRISKNQIIWGGNYFDLLSCNHYIIWDKQIPKGLTFADCEMAWTSFNKAPRIFRHSTYSDKKNKFHPTQKPIQLYKWLLENYAKLGDKIIDTHLGSGSSRIAAYDMGFDFVGYELDIDYFKAHEKRFNEFKMQGKLF